MALFENNQWAVTDKGLESIKPGAPYEYYIDASRLLETQGAGAGKFYDWPLQLAEKTWIDFDAFVEAFKKALEIHKGKYKGTADPALVDASIKEAKRRNA